MATDIEPEASICAGEWNPAAWARMVEAVNRLEAAWKQETSPDLAAFIPAEEDCFRERILAELIKVDQECRWRSGEQRFVEAYLSAYPHLAGDAVIIRELLTAECWTRIVYGVAPTDAELRSRFPTVTDVDIPAIVAEVESDRTSARLRKPGSEDGIGTTDTDTGGGSRANEVGTTNHPASPISTAPESPLAVGKSFGRFQICEVLGYGSMGIVYRAYDPNLMREVALKAPHFDSVQTTQEFLKEARVAAHIRHSHICPIYEAGEIDGQYYIILALINGEALSVRWKRQLPSPDEATGIVVKVAKALDSLHREGIIHQDIKPQNILLDEHGEPLLTDFGLASRTSAAPDGFMGTPAYMPPEQLVGEPSDQRSDVYSLGVVLYQALTGELPFVGSLSEVVMGILHRDPPAPQTRRPELDETLSAICLKAIAKERIHRYQTAGDFAAALEHREKPAVIDTGAPTPRRRKVMERVAVGIGCLAAVSVIIWFAGGRQQGSTGNGKPPATPDQVDHRSATLTALPPGTDASTAVPLDLGPVGRASAAGEVNSSSETQWFCVKSVHTGLLLIEALTPTDEFDGKMTVFDADLKELAEDGNSGPANDSQVVLSVVQAGDYFVTITSTQGRNGPFLVVASQPKSAPQMEPFLTDHSAPVKDAYGDSPSEPHAMRFDEAGHAVLIGSISVPDDEDWIVLKPPENGVILIRSETPHSSLDTLVELYEETTFLRRHRDRIVFIAAAHREYRLRIRGNGPSPGFSRTGNYVLRFRLLPDDIVPTDLRNTLLNSP
ncbi:MAG: serine/threonine protein kinase [Schlesneria sp.]|nr:serine/threonine protein kinase [Schlesneria sp.]